MKARGREEVRESNDEYGFPMYVHEVALLIIGAGDGDSRKKVRQVGYG